MPQHQAFLRGIVAAAVSGSPSEKPSAAYWEWYKGEGGELARNLADPQLRGAWRQLGAAHADFLAAADSCFDAVVRGERVAALSHMSDAFAASARLTTLLVGASLQELTQAFAGREQALIEQYERDFLDAAQIGRFSVDAESHALSDCDENFAGFFGRERGALAGVDARELLGAAAYQEILAAAALPGKTARALVKTGSAGQPPLTLEVVAYLEPGRGRNRRLLRCFAVNMSQAESDAQQRRLLSAAIESSDQIVMITNSDKEIVYVNAAFTRVSGYEAGEVLGRHPRFLHGAETSAATRTTIRDALSAGRKAHAEMLNYAKDGRPYWIDMSIVPVTGGNGTVTHYIAIERDISERKAAETEMARLALEDHLTGLPNRRAAEERLQTEWNRARRDKSKFAVAIADIDRFKLVNDQYGHHVGDQALQHVADILAANLRGGDWIARWGGEEFLLCFHGLDSRGATTAGERLRKLIKSRPLKIPQGELPLTISAGISLYKSDSEGLDALLAQADSLLYEAKQSGRDKVLCAGFADGRRGSVIWEGSQVQSALHEKRIIPVFQPIVDLRSGAFIGEEALARIVTRDNTLIPAHDFIQAAEALHLVAAIDSTISSQAMARSAREEAGAGKNHFINLSPQFLADAERVGAFIECAGALEMLPGKRKANPIVIEITERQSGDMEKLKKHLQPLLDAGFRLALDDFGSGYSSFLYLADLPVNFLKIEGWMVRRIVRDQRTRQLVETLVNTARKFRILTVAECVEDAATAQVLCDIGVDWAQGYYFARPERE